MIYHDPTLKILDRKRAISAQRVYYQLWRNTVFAEWMASLDHPRTKAYHVNLVREGCEIDSAQEFRELIQPDFQDRFCRLTWEQIHEQVKTNDQLILLQQYLRTKTAGLAKAFRIV